MTQLFLRFRAFFERARDGKWTDGNGNYRSGATRHRRGSHVAADRFSPKLRTGADLALQRYFQPGELFEIVFSERSQSCYN
jgi:hypothetical protein